MRTDGFLRRGANVLAPGRGRTDGLLHVFAADTGAPPPISQSGTVATVAALSALESFVDSGVLPAAVALSAVESFAAADGVVTVAVLTPLEGLGEQGGVNPAAVLGGVESLADAGQVLSVTVLAGGETVVVLSGGLVEVDPDASALLDAHRLVAGGDGGFVFSLVTEPDGHASGPDLDGAAGGGDGDGAASGGEGNSRTVGMVEAG